MLPRVETGCHTRRVTIDRQRELIRTQARIRQDEDGTVVPSPGAECVVIGCAADTRLGTMQGGGPMLCAGFGITDQPCIARWLTETAEGTYEDWVANAT